MKLKHFIALIATCLPYMLLASEEMKDQARLLRFPATNGEELVFTYAGDLYKTSISGGKAEKITSFMGYEMFPKFSPDGNTIAFTGEYDGNTEVYTMPKEGGEPLRLTYTATNSRDDLGDRMGPNNIVLTWTPNGKNILYRNRISTGFDGKLMLVGKEGGLSEKLPLPEGGFSSYSPDGKKLAYNRVMREFRTWKYYKGGMADDIWIYDSEKQSVENITNNPYQDIFPMWIKNQIYFVSDRDRVANLFVYDLTTKKTSKVTNFNEYDVKFPTSFENLIVFENGGYIYKYDVTTKKSEKIDVTLHSDNIYARNKVKNGEDYVTSTSLSPNGERLAVTARGEVFDVPVKSGVVKNLTLSSGANDRSARWSPDSKHIAYISDKTGETEIYLYNVESKVTKQATKKNKTYITSILWSPDSKTVAYTDRKNSLWLLDVASLSKQKVYQGDISGVRGVNFSPDNKWLTYARTGENDFSIVYLYNIEDKKEYAVTDYWYSSSSPAFSQDGKYLILSSARDFNPTYSQTEWNHSYGNMSSIYLVLLSKDTPSPFIIEDDAAIEESSKDAKESNTTKVNGDIVIDIDGIGERLIGLGLPGGSYSNFYGINNKVYYWSRGSTSCYDLKTKKSVNIAQGYMTITPGSKKALFSNRGQLYVQSIPTSSVKLTDLISLKNIKINVDYKEEWGQIYDEVWRAFRDGFYLENMHGHDWDMIKRRYEVFLPYVKHRLDLNYILGEMIAELGVGHSYVNPGEYEKPKRLNLGLLGAEISRDKSGFFKLEKILKGASWSKKLRSPLTEAGIDAKEGEFIVSIDGIPTNSVKDMYSLLVEKANVPTELMLNSKPQLNGARKVIITPLSEEYSLYHYNWIEKNIALVDKASGGKIGYIYIPDMGVDGLNEFSRYFYPQLNKEGLIIDDRANGGGNVSPMILERLAREPYRLNVGRHSAKVSTIPDAVHVGPKVCLINKYSASDGDLFPWGFKKLGLGKLIGTRTWGGIIGISGSLPYIDGTDVRVPFFTSFDPATGDWIIENHGVDPDIYIDNDPIKEFNGEDEQLNRAIEEVMKELKNRKALPGAPKPRDWSK